MFRKKDEEHQEELDVIDTNEKTNEATQSSYQPNNPDANRAAVGGRAPAPTAPVPGYRPQQAGAPAAARPAAPQQAAAPQTARPAGMSPAGETRSQTADVRQSPAGGMKTNKRILTVGNDILLKGEIATCDRLVIEGMVDASLKDVHTVEISETGSFKGTAEIEDAEISGLFEGDLIVRNRLTIYSTGKVRGKISYGEIEIERGGELSGEIRSGSAANTAKSADSKDKKAAA
jgi:cytoskeletal protein CcmA (bactofilin family)